MKWPEVDPEAEPEVKLKPEVRNKTKILKIRPNDLDIVSRIQLMTQPTNDSWWVTHLAAIAVACGRSDRHKVGQHKKGVTAYVFGNLTLGNAICIPYI